MTKNKRHGACDGVDVLLQVLVGNNIQSRIKFSYPLSLTLSPLYFCIPSRSSVLSGKTERESVANVG